MTGNVRNFVQKVSQHDLNTQFFMDSYLYEQSVGIFKRIA